MGEKMNPVIWFEIPVMDMARGKAFYEAVFDQRLTVVEMGPRQMAMFLYGNGCSRSWRGTGKGGKLCAILCWHAGIFFCG